MKKYTALILATILMFNFAFVVHAAEEESPVTESVSIYLKQNKRNQIMSTC